jgi:hypothetical protein
MARLTDEEFRAWCQSNKIEPQTEAYIQRVRESEPSRKVQSRASNVSGRYPSVKMGSRHFYPPESPLRICGAAVASEAPR